MKSTSIKTMLAGITIILITIFMEIIEQQSWEVSQKILFWGAQYYFFIIGIIVVVVGLFIKDKK